MKIQHFTEIINFFKLRKAIITESNKLSKFESTFIELKQLVNRKKNYVKRTPVEFNNIISDLHKLKVHISSQRKAKTEQLIRDNPDKLKISTFELMEHDFRENTHSNVLQYIFNSSRNFGPNILYKFLQLINDNSITDLEDKLNCKQYYIEREKFTGKGRIDLLVSDHKNKFIIVIENKLLAHISIIEDKENEYNTTTSKTQLHVYKNYIDSKYRNYQKLFVLLSYRLITEEFPPWKVMDYNKLYTILKEIESSDAVLEEYKLLLSSIVNDVYYKKWLIETALHLTDKDISGTSLNTIEQINKILSV